MPICGLFSFIHDEGGEKQLAEAQDMHSVYDMLTQLNCEVACAVRVSYFQNFSEKKLKLCLHLGASATH